MDLLNRSKRLARKTLDASINDRGVALEMAVSFIAVIVIGLMISVSLYLLVDNIYNMI